MRKSNEKRGELFILGSAMIWGIFPLVVNLGRETLSPLFFAAITTMLAAFCALIYSACTGKLGEFNKRESYADLLLITLYIVVIPYTLFFIGAGHTSGINSSLLLLSEMIFTLLLTPFMGEKTTWIKIAGASGVFMGGFLLLYDGEFNMNWGDLLVIISTFTYPIGNFYGKRALKKVSPATILSVRFFLGSLFLFILAYLFEPRIQLDIITDHLGIILFTGFILLGISKVFWYEGLKRVDISKANALGMTFPLFSILALIIYFGETPSTQQWIGIGVMAIGIYFSIKRRSAIPYSN